MDEWSSYRLGDFLMFSGRTYWRLFQLQNAALWPLPVAAPLAGGAAMLVAWRRPSAGLGLLCLLLALAWAWVGWSFVWQRYAPINWAMGYVAPAFGVQALLLALAAGQRAGGPPGLRGARGAVGAALLGWGLLLHPLAAPLFGRPLAQAEIAGIAPDPTAIATLGLALLLARRRFRPPVRAVLAVAVLWLALSALTLWTLGAAEAWVPIVALLLAACAIVASRR